MRGVYRKEFYNSLAVALISHGLVHDGTEVAPGKGITVTSTWWLTASWSRAVTASTSLSPKKASPQSAHTSAATPFTTTTLPFTTKGKVASSSRRPPPHSGQRLFLAGSVVISPPLVWSIRSGPLRINNIFKTFSVVAASSFPFFHDLMKSAT